VTEVAPALGRIGTDERLRAVRTVREGRVFDLGTSLGGDMPRGAALFAPYRWSSTHAPGRGPGSDGFEYSNDVISGCLHQSSHIDGLCHVQADGRIFGGATVADAYSDEWGWGRHGIETVPPIVGRGVLVDVPTALGLPRLEDGAAVSKELVVSALERQGTDLRSGDVVLVRTGKVQEYLAGRESYYVLSPGVSIEAGLWLYEAGMSVLGTDTSGTEPTPFAAPSRTLHRALLVERGVHLLEILNLEELAAAEAYEFLFVCSPLKIVGATGSWVRPVAIV
jgi:kynurenine formamidase